MNDKKEESLSISRRNFMRNTGIIAAGGIAALGAATASAPARAAVLDKKKATTVPLSWKEVYYTNCPLVSASNVDQELGWTKEEYKKIDVAFAYFRSRRENNWYPHYVHNLDNLIRFGGLFPPIQNCLKLEHVTVTVGAAIICTPTTRLAAKVLRHPHVDLGDALQLRATQDPAAEDVDDSGT